MLMILASFPGCSNLQYLITCYNQILEVGNGKCELSSSIHTCNSVLTSSHSSAIWCERLIGNLKFRLYSSEAKFYCKLGRLWCHTCFNTSMSEIQLYATKNLFPVAPHHSYGCETLVLELPEFDYSVAAEHVRSHSGWAVWEEGHNSCTVGQTVYHWACPRCIPVPAVLAQCGPPSRAFKCWDRSGGNEWK